MNEQPEALRLADALEGHAKQAWTREEAAAELRRLYAEYSVRCNYYKYEREFRALITKIETQ